MNATANFAPLSLHAPWNPPLVQWVVKASKHCNLRCRYCYEYPFLGNKQRMEPAQLRGMFQHIAEYYAGTSKRMDFVWHGGEPLLHKAAYYHEIEGLQQEAFDGSGVAFTNSIQTNLTILNDEVIDLMKGFFSHIGVSIDLFGDQRVNIAGRTVERNVLENMQTLKDIGIRFGCITVLSQETVAHVEKIYQFFDDIDTSFRLLPIYRTGFSGQQDRLAVSDIEIVDAFKKIVDLWFSSDSTIQVRPIYDYVAHVIRQAMGSHSIRQYYNKEQAEVVYIVDTDGSLYSNGDAYEPQLCHGNIFFQSLDEIRQSSSYRQVVALAHGRLADACSPCAFHGACSGFFMAESTPEQRWLDSDGRLTCGVAKPVQEYILQVMTRAQLIDASEGILLNDRLEERMLRAVNNPPFVG